MRNDLVLHILLSVSIMLIGAPGASARSVWSWVVVVLGFICLLLSVGIFPD